MTTTDTFLVSFTCSSTGHPAVGRFAWLEGSWLLVGASRQRPGTTLPPEDSAQTRTGRFGLAADYRGCPTCRADDYVRCGACRQLACYDNSWPMFTCPTCGNGGPVSGGIDSVSSMVGG
jgi:predicted RNA-binding Zn-ribbon protein involved in translation (DUF1610 family)